MMHRLPLLALIVTLLLGFHATASEACVTQGFCDLSTETWQAKPSQILSGEWQFFWEQLLSPEDVAQGKGQRTGFLSPEVDWKNAHFSGIEMHPDAYATYVLDFKVSPAIPLTLRFPKLPSAVRVWLNDVEIASIGTPSIQGREEEARQRQFFHNYLPKEGINRIIIQQTNFSFVHHGGNGGVVIGPNQSIMKEFQSNLIRDALTFGAILIMAFYHFYLWWIRPSRRAPLYFGIFCFVIGLRSLVAGSGELLTTAFPETPLELQLKIEYMGIALTLMSMTLFINELYPREFKKYLSIPIAGVSFAWFVLIMLSSANVYPRFLAFFQLLTAVNGCLMIVAIALAKFRKKEGAGVFMLGFGVFFLATINDVLGGANIMKTTPLLHVGTFCLVFFQSILLSKRFDHAFDLAERAGQEIKKLNEGLEQKVRDRTEEINTILANVSSGFLVIDRRGHLQAGFTESCHKLLGIPLTPGQRIFDELAVDADTKACFSQAVIQVLEDLMPQEVSLSQIPARVRIADRTLSVSGAPLRNQQSGQVSGILFTINDVSSLQDAERQVRYNEMLLNIISEKESFRLFIKDYNQELAAARDDLERGQQSKVRAFLHTMKGNLSAFGIYDLVDKIHEFEGHTRITKDDLDTLSELMVSLLSKHAKLLGLDAMDTAHYEIAHAEFHGLLAYIETHIQGAERTRLIQRIQKSCEKPVRAYLGPMQNNVAQLAQRLGKKVRCDLVGDEQRIPSRYSPILRNLVHLVRNAVDHGIELPEDRGDKDPEGQIRLSFFMNPKLFTIVVEDDGQGLNYPAIRLKARQLGLITDSHAEMSEQDLNQLILLPSFSTATEVSDISGRGVGMDAIVLAVNELQGTIQMSSQTGLGVRIEITLPVFDGSTDERMNVPSLQQSA